MDAVAQGRRRIEVSVLGLWPHVFLGLLAALGLLVFYLGVITLAQDWGHAIQQLAADRWFVAAIITGFGTQVGLFSYLRRLHRQAMAGGLVVSTGTSTAAMLACCAHHLTEVAPILGLSGVAIFLNVYKLPLLWLGIVMNLVGIGYMFRKVRQQRSLACHAPLQSTLPIAPVQPEGYNAGEDRMKGGDMEMVKDPVCGMEVDPQTTTLKAEYKGQTYYFCAPGCKREFERNPEKYVGKAAEHAGHNH